MCSLQYRRHEVVGAHPEEGCRPDAWPKGWSTSPTRIWFCPSVMPATKPGTHTWPCLPLHITVCFLAVMAAQAALTKQKSQLHKKSCHCSQQLGNHCATVTQLTIPPNSLILPFLPMVNKTLLILWIAELHIRGWLKELWLNSLWKQRDGCLCPQTSTQGDLPSYLLRCKLL